MKEQHDGAEPSGNSVATANLLRLAAITDDQFLKERATATLSAFSGALQHQPVAMPNMVAALDSYHGPPLQVVIAGQPDDPGTAAIMAQVTRTYLPNKVVLFLLGGEDEAWLKSRVPWVAAYTTIDGRPTAYVCRNFTCDLPTTSPAKVGELLRGASPTR
jgi:uncharacterized protein YyaL (SSP411 family)